jgi:hypothetical protein
MALKDLEAFNGLSIITSEMDEIEVGHLLKAHPTLGLICQDCGGQRFKAEAYIPAEIEILTGSEHILLTNVEYKKVAVNRVLECATCQSTDFITITESQENNNGQK